MSDKPDYAELVAELRAYAKFENLGSRARRTFDGAADAIASLQAERDEDKRAFDESEMALCAKLQALAPHGTCACSYDTAADRCVHHSPQLVAMTAERDALQSQLTEAREALRRMEPYRQAIVRIFRFKPDTSLDLGAFEQIAIEARSAAIDAQTEVAALTNLQPAGKDKL
jgi:hypothetical protein